MRTGQHAFAILEIHFTPALVLLKAVTGGEGEWDRYLADYWKLEKAKSGQELLLRQSLLVPACLAVPEEGSFMVLEIITGRSREELREKETFAVFRAVFRQKHLFLHHIPHVGSEHR